MLFEQQAVSGASDFPAQGADFSQVETLFQVIRVVEHLDLAHHFFAFFGTVDNGRCSHLVLLREIVEVVNG